MKGKCVWALLALALPGTLLACVCLGSVPLPLGETLGILRDALGGSGAADYRSAIVLTLRLPRALCAALVGAALSLCGAVMQGLLRNPLADGSTLGVTSGASLGAALALAFGVSLPGLPLAGPAALAMLFALGSLALILGLSFALDRGLSTQTLILIGVIFSMFASSLISLTVAFAGEKAKSYTFWTLGSLAGSTYGQAGVLGAALACCGAPLLGLGRALNALALGEEQARSLGVAVRRVKLTALAAVAALLGLCVAVGGSIGFVGLVAPHAVRLLLGPDHRRLLPASLLAGAVFLPLADLAARTVFAPVELPIGVVTSLVGAAAFGAILFRARGRGRGA